MNTLLKKLGATAFAFCILHFALKSQPGCTDPQALNFDPAAAANDGSCQYPPTTLAPVKIADLPAGLFASSGLVAAGGRMWTHNDSDGIPKLFSIDTTTGQVLQTVDLQGLAKTDWEDVATDGQHLFIGDFGNNWAGNRTDLTIYSIDLALIKSAGDDTLDASEVAKIPFAWPDQTDFTPAQPNATAFDCEAFFWKDGRLHLFSKNWVALKTTHYALDPATGICEKLEEFPGQSGLVTAAGLAADGSTIALLGYDLGTFSVFAWLLWDYPGEQFFSGNKRKITLGLVVPLGQAEGLAWSPGGGFGGFLSNEKIQQVLTIPAALWRFDFSPIFEKVGSGEPSAFSKKEWTIYPNPAAQTVHFQPVEGGRTAVARLFDGSGRMVFEQKTMGELALPDGLPNGLYQLEIWAEGRRLFSKKLVVKAGH